jgi:carbamoyltransferase
MPTTLGISCFYHDAAAAIVRDGDIVAAAQEERFSRIKGDPSFPVSAINFCLEEAGVDPASLDSVVFYDKPILTFERLTATWLAVAPRGVTPWLTAMPEWIAYKFRIPILIRKALRFDGPVLFTPHHLAHAASAYYPSPYDNAAILTMDGVGEWGTATCGRGVGRKIELLEEQRFPDSLGLLYSAVTYFCGFKVNSGEYKLMGLAPYGEPRYAEVLKEKVVRVRDDGSVQLNMDYFGYLDSLCMVSGRFEELLGGPARKPESRITSRETDLAASVQQITDEAVLKMAIHAHKVTGAKHLCMAGGVALNCVANGVLAKEGPFEAIWIQPAAGDAGGALGAALAVQHGYHGVERAPVRGLDRQKGTYLGPAFSEQEVRACLDGVGARYRKPDLSERAEIVAAAVAEGRTVGLFAGRMEFGPRALGGRSILGDATRPDTQRVMNLKIKYRESFRPFAPAVLAERASEYFEMDAPSPYMLFVAPVRGSRRLPVSSSFADDEDLLEKVNQRRSDIPSVTHIDYSARVQTVHKETNPFFHSVLDAYERRTGCAVMVNTSFNVRGEPIVCTPLDAYRCFMRTDMDNLYVEGYWLEKSEQPPLREDGKWRETLVPD